VSKETRHDLAWAITHRLNRFTKKFLGPAQLGEMPTTPPRDAALPGTPCRSCGKPLSTHELVRTDNEKMRLYCPRDEA
jgi:hypothetical protein